MSSKISAATSKYASVAGHFSGHVEALKQSMWHCPMQHVQGYIGSHWTLPSGDYSLCIAPAAAIATINKTTMQKVPSLLAVLMAITMRRYYIVHISWWRRFVAFIKATKRHHWVCTRSDITNWTHQCRLILTFHPKKGLQLTCWHQIKIGVWHIKLTGTT